MSVIGTGLLLATNHYGKSAFDIAETPSITHRDEKSSEKLSLSTIPTGQMANDSGASVLAVKTVYQEMAQYVSMSGEYFVLQDPAYLRNLLDAVMLRHPSISSQMIATMLILIDGTPSKPSACLKDGDQVDFIPLVTGG